MAGACPRCGCTRADDAHAIQHALLQDDFDAALDAGMLEASPCPDCHAGCNAALAAARKTRASALDARSRHRAREARLQRRKAERDAARRPPVQAGSVPAGLPPAAADALARALAKARERRR